METLPHHHLLLQEQARFALLNHPTTNEVLLTLNIEPPDAPFERFDLLTSDGGAFWFRRVWWDRKQDTLRMETYHQRLEGVERIREKHRPRAWDPTLHEEESSPDPEKVKRLLESFCRPDDLAAPDREQGMVYTLSLADGTHLVWNKGEAPELDLFAAEVQSLLYSVAGVDSADPGMAGADVVFPVDDVAPATTALQEVALKNLLETHLKTDLLSSSFPEDQRALHTSGTHALISAVHQAFSQHYPLTLSPDALWITLSQGVALHIQNNAEDLRHLFVSHQGKETLTVVVASLSTPEDWAHTVQLWTEGIRERVGAETSEVFECDFSTTTPITQTASQIVMMDGFREYFDYEVICVCGIPEIRLRGTVADWIKLKQKVMKLDEWGLSWWTRHLLPLCDQWILTAKGQGSRTFWQSIYKPEQFYGPEQTTGWLKFLFPYLKESSGGQDTYTRKNPCLEGPFRGFVTEAGLTPDDAPDGISRVLFTLTEPLRSAKKLQLLAGCLGITQDPQSLHIEPLIGWAVSPLSTFASANSEDPENRRKIDLNVLSQLGVEASIVEDLRWTEGISYAGTHRDWSFLLGDVSDHGKHVLIGQGKPGRVLLHKETGHIHIADPDGEHIRYSNQDFSSFHRAVEAFQHDYLSLRRPEEEASVNHLAHARRTQHLLEKVDGTAFEDPQSFWTQVLMQVEQGTV